MRVMGIDPGSRRTGWGFVDGEGSRFAFAGAGVIAAGDGSLAERLRVIGSGIEALIAEHRPDVVSVEDVFRAKNSQSALKLGQARGVVIYCAASADLDVHAYAPTQVKQAVTGRGGAGKEQVRDMVRMILSVREELPLDASDALAIAICHLQTASSRIAQVTDRESGNAPRARKGTEKAS